MQTNIQALAVALATAKRCERPDAPASRVCVAWRDLCDAIMRDAPSGSGIDAGTELDEARSTSRRIVLFVAFHHMDEAGGYDGWTSHNVIITPRFDGIDVRVTGKDRNGIKEYLADTYYVWAQEACPHKFTLPAHA